MGNKLPDGGRVRVSKSSGAIIPKPVPPPRERDVNADTDTPASVVLRNTYVKPDYDLIIARKLVAQKEKEERQAREAELEVNRQAFARKIAFAKPGRTEE